MPRRTFHFNQIHCLLLIFACGFVWSCSGGLGGPTGEQKIAVGSGSAAQPMDTGFAIPAAEHEGDEILMFKQASSEAVCKNSFTEKMIVRFSGVLIRSPKAGKEPSDAGLDNLTLRIFDLDSVRFQDTTTKFDQEHGSFATKMAVKPGAELRFGSFMLAPENPDALQVGWPEGQVHVDADIKPVTGNPDAEASAPHPAQDAPKVKPGYAIEGTPPSLPSADGLPECQLASPAKTGL